MEALLLYRKEMAAREECAPSPQDGDVSRFNHHAGETKWRAAGSLNRVMWIDRLAKGAAFLSDCPASF